MEIRSGNGGGDCGGHEKRKRVRTPAAQASLDNYDVKGGQDEREMRRGAQ